MRAIKREGTRTQTRYREKRFTATERGRHQHKSIVCVDWLEKTLRNQRHDRGLHDTTRAVRWRGRTTPYITARVIRLAYENTSDAQIL